MNRRLLAINDLETIHWNVGEHIFFQEQTLIERIKCEADIIDIVWIYNPSSPAFGKTGVTKDNYHYYLSKLLPIAQINIYLGSFTLTDSLGVLGAERYEHVFPSLDIVKAKEKIFKWPIIKDFYDNHRFIPYISCKEGMLLWARSFFELRGIIFPVVVHLRRSERNSRRNSNFDVWMKFFIFCCSKKKWRHVTFVIIGTRQEIDPRLRRIGNVIFAKDYNTTIEQDCALIQSSLMFMGGPNGPGSFPVCGNIPYLFFNYSMPSQKNLDFQFIKDSPTSDYQWPWHTSLQKLIWVPETIDSLIEEFGHLVSNVDFSEWRKKHAEKYIEPNFPKLKRMHRQKPDDW